MGRIYDETIKHFPRAKTTGKEGYSHGNFRFCPGRERYVEQWNKGITAANAQMLFHYWKMGNYILYHQNLQGWGSKIIKQLAKAIRFNYPEKKGYSERNLTYMCQFARSYPLNVLRSFIDTDARQIGRAHV